MAVAFDFASNSSNVNVNSISWNHTCTGTDRLLIVDVVVGQVGDSGITVAVTYNGVAMTSLGRVHSNAGTDGFVEMFKLVNPSSGNNGIIASTSISVNSLIGGSISFTGVEQNVGVLTPVTATGNSNTPSVTITTARKGSMIVDGVADGSTINSSNQTSRFLLNQNGNSGAGNGGGSTAAGGTSVTMSYGGSATDWWAIIAAEVIPSFHLVQHTSNTATSTVSVAKAFTSSPVQNNQLMCFCRAGGTGTLSISDTDGNTWNSLTAANSSGNHVSQVFYVANRLGTGADTVTCNWTGSSTTMSMLILEYSGLDPLSMVDCQNQAAGTGNTGTLTGNSCTTTNANDLIVGAAGLGADTTWSAASGFTLEESTARLGWEDKLVSATGSQTPTMGSTATGSSWTFTTASFKTLIQSGGGGGPTTDQLSPSWYADADGQLWDTSYRLSSIDAGFESFGQPLVNGAPVTPIRAYDEVDWQHFVGMQIGDLAPDIERPTTWPIPSNPPPLLFNFLDIDDFKVAQYEMSGNAFTWDVEEFVNPVLVSSINLFDDFEPDYSNVSLRSTPVQAITLETDNPTLWPLFIPINVLNAQFDDWDWSRQFVEQYRLFHSGREIGLVPVLPVFVVVDESQDQQKAYSLVYASPVHEDFEGLSLFANFPPPPAPTFVQWGGEDLLQQNWTFQFSKSTEEEFWNPTLVNQINFFDDFEVDYSQIPRFPAIVHLMEEPFLLFPVPIPVFKLTGFQEDGDYSRWSPQSYTPQITEEDPGLIVLPSDSAIIDSADLLARYFPLIYAKPVHEGFEELSIFANFPPPAPPTWVEWGDEVGWQHDVGYRLSQATTEEDLLFYPVLIPIPLLGYEEGQLVNKFYELRYVGTKVEDFEDQTLGWFLNPAVPPPPPFCPLPPTGPDGDVAMSNFGGNRPTLALFCRICKSGKPLIVRADFAIWCQDCCAFVSKQDTYMGTVRAPGKFRGIF